MKKTRTRFWLYLLLTLGWLIFIAMRSLKTATQSDQESRWLLDFLNKYIPWLSMRMLRKMAHFGEFAVFGGLLTLFCLQLRRVSRVLPYLLGLLAALCDETLQLFITGRNGSLIDVWIDSAGFALFASVILLLDRRARRKNEERAAAALPCENASVSECST